MKCATAATAQTNKPGSGGRQRKKIPVIPHQRRTGNDSPVSIVNHPGGVFLETVVCARVRQHAQSDDQQGHQVANNIRCHSQINTAGRRRSQHGRP